MDDTKKSHADEIEKLYAQIGQLQVENTFLKKKIVVDKTSTQRKEMIEKEHESLSVERQCQLIEVSRSSFYYTSVEESKENLAIMRYLDEQYMQTPFYGYRKLTALLAVQGFNINEKRVRRLMEIVGWQTIYRAPKTSMAATGHEIHPYLLKGLLILHRNQVWATDITYIPMIRGFVYLMAVIDVYSRYVVHWSLSNTMPAEWCAATLKEALAKGEKPQIMNTDQGSQFTSKVFIDVLKENKIQISMDGKGRAIDNIFIERLWRSVKYEQVYLHVAKNATVLYQDLEKYIAFYNDRRLHQSLDYATPLSKYQMVA